MDPIAVSVINPIVGSPLSRVVARMMARIYAERYERPAEVRRALQRIQNGEDPLADGLPEDFELN